MHKKLAHILDILDENKLFDTHVNSEIWLYIKACKKCCPAIYFFRCFH